jgi:hypothetical protein
MANIKIMSLFNIPTTRFPFIAYLPTLPWLYHFIYHISNSFSSYKHKSEEGGGGSPRPGTGEGEASGGVCVGCNGALSEWRRDSGQLLRETVGRQRDDHDPTLEWARPTVKAMVVAGRANGGWAGDSNAGVRWGWGGRCEGAVTSGRRREGAMAGRRRRQQRWWATAGALCVRVWLRACVF